MRKKVKKTSKIAEAWDSSFKQKLTALFLPIQLYVNQIPAVVALKTNFKIIKDIVSEKLRQFILAFLAFFAPCWNFFFLGTPKPNTDNSQDTNFLLQNSISFDAFVIVVTRRLKNLYSKPHRNSLLRGV